MISKIMQILSKNSILNTKRYFNISDFSLFIATRIIFVRIVSGSSHLFYLPGLL